MRKRDYEKRKQMELEQKKKFTNVETKEKKEKWMNITNRMPISTASISNKIIKSSLQETQNPFFPRERSAYSRKALLWKQRELLLIDFTLFFLQKIHRRRSFTPLFKQWLFSEKLFQRN